MPRLDSSAIRKVTYNPKTEKMNVQFVGKGKQYTYVGVPEDVYRDFVNAPSAGKFFNDNIKDDYIAVPSEFVGSVRFDTPDDEDFYEERNMSGKELNEFFVFGDREPEPDPRLVDIFKNQLASNELRRKKEVLKRIKERGRLPRDPDIIDPTFRKPVPQTLSRRIGEEISESKSVLREFQFTDRPSPRLDPNFYRLGTEKNPIRFGGGGGGAGGRPAGIGIGSLIGAGVGALGSLVSPIFDPPVKGFQQPGTGGPRRSSHGPVPGFRQPSTGGPNRGGRGPRQPGTGGSGGSGGSGGRPIVKDAIELFGSFGKMLKSLAVLLGLGSLGSGAVWLFGKTKEVVIKANEETDKIIDSAFFLPEGAKEKVKKNKAILLAFLVLAGGSAEILRRSIPKIKRVLTNRRIAVEIEKALDAGDEDLARTILFDAVEDEGINLSGLRRRLSSSDYQRLYRDT